ncbi:MAG: 4-phosphopantetheinyl transferase [Flavobacterium sp.]|nr:4-phosphopantetheinyl transferase [Flavobacterium sp.]
MPLYKDIHLADHTRILVWNISESENVLQRDIFLNQHNLARFRNMKSEMHRRAFLSVRKLMKLAGYSDADLYYDTLGKPNLRDNKHISITHSHEYSAIIVSDKSAGIDLEWARAKVLRIADKFASDELLYLPEDNPNRIQILTVIWGVKESIFKIRNEAGISFKDHIYVPPFDLEGGKAQGVLTFAGETVNYNIEFITFADFVLVWAFESESQN